MRRTASYLICSFLVCISLHAQQSMDLSGEWLFQIDREDKGISEQWYQSPLKETIQLPGSMPEKGKGDDVSIRTKWTGSLYDSSYYYNPLMAKYRVDGNVKFPFFLTPSKHYVGVAWYQKEIVIPKEWKGKRIVLFLERPHIETTVWVDNKEVGMQNSLCIPHIHDLSSMLSVGKHRISIRVDNRIKEINVGQDSHSITDQTQGNWNGIVGKIALNTTSGSFIDDIQIFPNIQSQKALVKIKMMASRNGKATMSISAQAFNTEKQHLVPTVSKEIELKVGENQMEMELPMGKEMLLWDEFSPALYKLKAELNIGKEKDFREVQFGMREFSILGKWFYINGRKTMLRGTVENCCFPLTGYAPMDVDAWMRVFRICRSYGLNHMRFHSFCPPEAAFIAADRVGFYLQPEGPSWPNHGSNLGYNRPIDTYLMDETIRMSKEYGNYASFCMLACGNEPAGRWVDWVSKFVNYWKKTDSRRVYTGASVGGSWAWQPQSQYHVKAGARGLDWTGKAPETLSDFRSRIDTVSQPYVSHETGQWCVFPNFGEIRKYTGVNKAYNFEIFRDLLRDNQMGELGHDFMMASGKLQSLCYKYEIEKTMRTPDYAGFQLLSLNDYSGQGSALVGVLDVFWGEKGYIQAPEFRRFCNSTVLLSRMPKFVYSNKDTMQAAIEIAHFGASPLKEKSIKCKVRNSDGDVVLTQSFNISEIEIGNCQNLGTISLLLKNVTIAEKMNLEVCMEGTDIVNDWNFWVYPETKIADAKEIYVADSLDEKALTVLKDGGKVLITAAGKIKYGKDIVQYFTPIFWNTSWFKMRPPHTTGIFLNEYHPLFKHFPTSYHSDLQWWELVNRSQVMQFTEFPKEFQPLVQTIDTWFISRKCGLLFEANVLNGKMMMCSMDLKTNIDDKRLVAKQLYNSIIDYMNSDSFQPDYTVVPEQINDLFTQESSVFDMHTKDMPDELKVNRKKK